MTTNSRVERFLTDCAELKWDEGSDALTQKWLREKITQLEKEVREEFLVELTKNAGHKHPYSECCVPSPSNQ